MCFTETHRLKKSFKNKKIYKFSKEKHETQRALGITSKTPHLETQKKQSDYLGPRLKAKTQKDLHDLLRVLAGQIAQRITGAVKGRKNRFSFWLKPAWKRIVYWGRDFLSLNQYIYLNQLESLGLIAYQPRKRKPPPRQ